MYQPKEHGFKPFFILTIGRVNSYMISILIGYYLSLIGKKRCG